jgi:DNA polymerase beta
MSDYKGLIVDALNVMRRKELADKQKFKAAAYSKVIKQIDELPAVRSRADLAGVTGIGEKISEKIDEIMATGSLRAAERAKAEKQLDLYDVLTTIHGIGPAKAKQLIDSGIRNIASLRAAVNVNPSILSNIQRTGLKYYEDINERIPREEIALHEEIIQKTFRSTGLEATIVGSYRRGLTSSGDIDVLVTGNQGDFIAGLIKLHKEQYIVETLAEGVTKGMYITRLGPAPHGKARRVDLLYTPPKEYPYAVLYFTGSKEFNVAMRKLALDRGYSLNEHGLTNLSTGELVEGLGSEQNIFNFLGLEYVRPENRIGASALVAAAATPMPVPAAPAPAKKLKIIRISEAIQGQLQEYSTPIGKRQLGDNDTVYYFTRAAPSPAPSILKVRLSTEHGAQSEVISKQDTALANLTRLDVRRLTPFLSPAGTAKA